MKSILYIFSAFLIVLSHTLIAQSDTITGWDFSDTTNSTFSANLGLASNHSYTLRAEDTAGSVRTLAYVNGATDFAASTKDWDNGADNKFWTIKFKADGYSSFKLYSVQSSDAAAPGPKYWKVQTRLSNQSYVDVTGGSITVASDWTTGVVNGLPLPASLDNPGSTSVYVNWMVTSNEGTDGNPVLPGGISMIDDIMVTGISSTGIETVLYDSRIKISPNPASEFINISLGIETNHLQLHDASGSLVLKTAVNNSELSLQVGHLKSGIYILSIIPSNDNQIIRRKIFIRR